MASPSFLGDKKWQFSGNDDFVLFDSLDGNNALFANVAFMRYSSFAHMLNLNIWMET